MSDAFAARAHASRQAFDALIERDAPHLASALPPGWADAAERYVELLLRANARLNLTRVVEPEAVARLHLLDTVAALPHLEAPHPDRALDLGSGGGVPGLLLALAMRDTQWTLDDSVGRKADALRSFVADLSLGHVDVRAERAELLGRGPDREAFDLVTARACAALPVLAEYALPLLRVGGALVAWKGRMGDDELAAGDAAARLLGGSVSEVRPTGVPALGDHRFVLVRKLAPTDPRYPRRPGQPARQPLA